MKFSMIALITCLLLGCGANRSLQKGDKVITRFEGDTSAEKMHFPGQEEKLKSSKLPIQSKK